VKQKLVKLKSFDLCEWVGFLDPILDQFIFAKKGKLNWDFWSKICTYKSNDSGLDELSGWITVFTIYNQDGKWQGQDKCFYPDREYPVVNMEDLVSGIVCVDVAIDNNGTEYKAVMLAGHVAAELLIDGCTIRPRSGWAMVLKSEE